MAKNRGHCMRYFLKLRLPSYSRLSRTGNEMPYILRHLRWADRVTFQSIGLNTVYIEYIIPHSHYNPYYILYICIVIKLVISLL